MNTEQDRINRALEKACSTLGVDAEIVRPHVALRVEDGEVVVVNPLTNCRQLSSYGDRTYASITEMVSRFAMEHPEAKTGKAAERTKYGLPEEIFDGMSATARLAQARRAGATASGPQKPTRRAPTVAEAEKMQTMGPIERLRFARKTGICS